jgi:hypothetical protein
MSNFTTLFEDVNGGLSMMRVVFALVTLTIMLNWTYVNFMKGELVSLDTNLVTLIIGLAGAKAVQRFGEKGQITEIDIDPTVSTSSSISKLDVTSSSTTPVKVTVENNK